MDPNHDSPSPKPPLDSPPQNHDSPRKSPADLPPLPHSPPPQPPQHDQDALPKSPVDSQETVVSDSEPPMKTFVIKYGETVISLKRPWHLFNGQASATPDSPQSKRRILSSPELSESSSDYSVDSSSYSSDSDSSVDSSSYSSDSDSDSDSDSSAKNDSPLKPSSP